jgi:hypothetical protein
VKEGDLIWCQWVGASPEVHLGFTLSVLRGRRRRDYLDATANGFCGVLVGVQRSPRSFGEAGLVQQQICLQIFQTGAMR